MKSHVGTARRPIGFHNRRAASGSARPGPLVPSPRALDGGRVYTFPKIWSSEWLSILGIATRVVRSAASTATRRFARSEKPMVKTSPEVVAAKKAWRRTRETGRAILDPPYPRSRRRESRRNLPREADRLGRCVSVSSSLRGGTVPASGRLHVNANGVEYRWAWFGLLAARCKSFRHGKRRLSRLVHSRPFPVPAARLPGCIPSTQTALRPRIRGSVCCAGVWAL